MGCSTPANTGSRPSHSRRQPGHRGARVRARARARAPRHQAGEPALRRARHPASRRLRPRRARSPRRVGPNRRVPLSVPLVTRRPSRRRARRSTAAPTCTRWPSCSWRRSRAPFLPCPTPRSARLRRARHTPVLAPLELGRLGPVVERAGRPDPAERYPDAATMGAALADAAHAFPPRSRSCFRDSAPTAAALSIPRRSTVFRRGCSTKTRRRTPQTRRRPSRCNTSEGRDHSVSSRWWSPSRSSQHWSRAASRSRRERRRRDLAVPSVVGLSLDQAKIGRGHGRAHRHDGHAQRRRPQGRGHRAAAGRRIVHGRRQRDPARGVARTTAGADPRRPEPVPEDAQARLEQDGFVVHVERPNDETVEYNHVINTDPPIGDSAARDSDITLLVSNGPAPVPIPDVSNKSYDEAAQELTRRALLSRAATTSATPSPSTRSSARIRRRERRNRVGHRCRSASARDRSW